MHTIETKLPGVVVVEPAVFEDARGFFMETWNRARYAQAGIGATFVQDNVSCSTKGTLRGLHFQYPHPQGKLVYVLQGEVYDVAVDVRVGSPTFGQWGSVVLSGQNKRQVYVPPGFAHGFCVTSDVALFAYKCTQAYDPQCDRGLHWRDPRIGIEWPLESPILSPKDRGAPVLSEIPPAHLPRYAESAA